MYVASSSRHSLGVLADFGLGVGKGAKGHHQPCSVPRCARGDLVRLEKDNVWNAELGCMVSDGGSYYASTNDYQVSIWRWSGGGS